MERYRICPICELLNPVEAQDALECRRCQADLTSVPISDGLPETASQGVECRGLKFVSLSDGYSIKIPIGGGVLGREGDIEKEYFRKHMYVSSLHARIDYTDGNYALMDVGSTNGCWINDKRLERHRAYPITEGDRVRIANLEFIVQRDVLG